MCKMYIKLSCFFSKINMFLFIQAEKERVLNSSKKYMKLMRKNGIKIKRLTKCQKLQVDKIYGKYKKGFYGHYSYVTHRLYYSVTGVFNPYVFPETLFRTNFNLFANKRDVRKGWVDKNYFNFFHPSVEFPQAIIRNVDGKYLDEKYNLLTSNEAKEILKKYNSVIVKSSLDSFEGRSVSLFEFPDLQKIEKNYKRDFIIQKKLNQHRDMAVLNSSSVNVVRIITIFANDAPELLMSALRVGSVGSLTDWSPNKDGGGAVIIGIGKTGCLNTFGYLFNGKKVEKTENGFIFGRHKIPAYNDMVRIALDAHKKMPMFRFIGWDFVCDENNHAVVMEYNLLCPGVLFYQYVNGPLFGENDLKIHQILENIGKR